MPMQSRRGEIKENAAGIASRPRHAASRSAQSQQQQVLQHKEAGAPCTLLETAQGQRSGKDRAIGRFRQLPGAEELRDPLQGQQRLQPAQVTLRREGMGVSPAGCSSGFCGAVAGALGKGQGLAVHFAT